MSKTNFFYNKSEVVVIKNLILSTTLDYVPKTKLEKVIRDLDLYYFGSSKNTFFKKILNLKKEVYFFKVKGLYVFSKNNFL